MINVDLSILKTLFKRFGLLRYQAVNDPKSFKQILYTIILKELIEWSEYNSDNSTRNKLHRMLMDCIFFSPDFELVKEASDNKLYRNVNTPQSTYTWNTIVNNPDYTLVDEYGESPIFVQQAIFYPDENKVVLHTECNTKDGCPTYEEETKSIYLSIHDQNFFNFA